MNKYLLLKLTKLASKLDSIGHIKYADELDGIITKLAGKDDFGDLLNLFDERVELKDEEDVYDKPVEVREDLEFPDADNKEMRPEEEARLSRKMEGGQFGEYEGGYTKHDLDKALKLRKQLNQYEPGDEPFKTDKRLSEEREMKSVLEEAKYERLNELKRRHEILKLKKMLEKLELDEKEEESEEETQEDKGRTKEELKEVEKMKELFKDDSDESFEDEVDEDDLENSADDSKLKKATPYDAFKLFQSTMEQYRKDGFSDDDYTAAWVEALSLNPYELSDRKHKLWNLKLDQFEEAWGQRGYRRNWDPAEKNDPAMLLDYNQENNADDDYDVPQTEMTCLECKKSFIGRIDTPLCDACDEEMAEEHNLEWEEFTNSPDFLEYAREMDEKIEAAERARAERRERLGLVECWCGMDVRPGQMHYPGNEPDNGPAHKPSMTEDYMNNADDDEPGECPKCGQASYHDSIRGLCKDCHKEHQEKLNKKYFSKYHKKQENFSNDNNEEDADLMDELKHKLKEMPELADKLLAWVKDNPVLLKALMLAVPELRILSVLV